MTLEIRKPIFVVGTGRSGSTLFFSMLSRHPNLAWPSVLSGRLPMRPALNRLLLRLRSNWILDDLMGRRFGPSEAYPFWDASCPGFSNPFRDLTAEDVTVKAATRLRDAIGRMLTLERNRFAAKITGWPRVLYLGEIFPDALFIDVTRSSCATAASLLEVPFWDGWRGPPTWRHGPLPPDLEEIWHTENKSFIALAAIDCIIVRRAMDHCRKTISESKFHAVSYSELCANPVEVFRSTIDFCELGWHPRFEHSIRRTPIINTDHKWRTSLTEKQAAVLLRTFERAGFLTEP